MISGFTLSDHSGRRLVRPEAGRVPLRTGSLADTGKQFRLVGHRDTSAGCLDGSEQRNPQAAGNAGEHRHEAVGASPRGTASASMLDSAFGTEAARHGWESVLELSTPIMRLMLPSTKAPSPNLLMGEAVWDACAAGAPLVRALRNFIVTRLESVIVSSCDPTHYLVVNALKIFTGAPLKKALM
ncbi:hypothetical protein LY76DRAFT_608088 [Colletotrichum caudatum]|nr:hypothetical protein LY76DRAFT_608088 [Colletotrichum caudatum]